MRMFEYTSTHRHSRNPGNKTSTDIRSSYTDNKSVSPLRLLHSEPLSNRHTCRRSLPHTGSGLFSLYAVMPANLWTGNANRGNLPSCSCVLRETVEAADPWLFLCGFGGTNRWTLWEEETRQSWAMPKILPRSSHSGSLKGTDKTRSPIIGPGLWKSIPLLTWGAPPKRFHIPASTRSFWQKKTSISERYELLISQPQYSYSPSVFFCPLSSPLPLTHYSFSTLLKRNRSVFCWAWGWSGPQMWISAF